MGGKSDGGSRGPSNQVPADFAADHPGATNADFFGAVRAAEARNQQQAQFEGLFGAFGGGHKPKGGGHESGGGGHGGASDEERKRIEGENNRDELFSLYLDAGDKATDFINDAIDQERSNAQLLGIDFDITDEQKTSRINDKFSEFFSEKEFSDLETSFDEFGDPEDFDGFTFIRGDAGDSDEGKQKIDEGAKAAPSTKSSQNLLSDDDKLGKASILG